MERVAPERDVGAGGKEFMGERAVAAAVWREALEIVGQHPVATVVPAAFLGMLAETPYLFPDSQSVIQAILAFLTEAFAFYLYVAYAEEVAPEA